ncbi:MAG: transglutaminase family protein, partial [Planctomycetota bacterium]
PPHAPLVFDLVDTWAADGRARSMGGCTYHATHPGGRSYDTFPVNANEAEARRTSRFVEIGHTAGELDTPEENVDPRSPMTLDLRTTLRSSD